MKIWMIAAALFLVGINGMCEEDPVLEEARDRPAPKPGSSYSILPLGGYNPVYGAFAGVGHFTKKETEDSSLKDRAIVLLVTQKKAAKNEVRYRYLYKNNWGLQIENELANGFESNYGLGNETLTAHRVDVPMWKDELVVSVPYFFSEFFSVGPLLIHQISGKNRIDPAEKVRERDPWPNREHGVGVGLLEAADFRNIPGSPSLGWDQKVRVVYVSSLKDKANSTLQVEAQLSFFQYLVDKDFVVAQSWSGGASSGRQAFFNRFRLGGSDKLRGFYTNRFRGAKYYASQSELRFPIYSFISGTTFLEVGEATEKHFGRAHVSYGGGLRIGLPPDMIEKVRIDLAFSRDQHGLIVDFGHAF